MIQLLKKGSILECLTSFYEWLNNTPNIHKPTLFAHNCRKFDSVVLGRSMRKCSDMTLQDCIVGFCDTLSMLKNHASCNTTNSTLATLVLEILGCTFEAHDVLEDRLYISTETCGTSQYIFLLFKLYFQYGL